MLKELIKEASQPDFSAEFSKLTGIKKDPKNIGKGDVYWLDDKSSVVIDTLGSIQHYDANMKRQQTYKSVDQAIKALGLNESMVLSEASEFEKEAWKVKKMVVKTIADLKKEITPKEMSADVEEGLELINVTLYNSNYAHLVKGMGEKELIKWAKKELKTGSFEGHDVYKIDVLKMVIDRADKIAAAHEYKLVSNPNQDYVTVLNVALRSLSRL